MNWTTYWANKPHLSKLSMKHPQYQAWLQDKNLAPNTIRLYLATLAEFKPKLSTENVKKYFKDNLKIYAPNSLKVKKYALNSYVKFKKLKIEWEKISRLIPSVQRKFFDTLNEPEFKRLKEVKVEKNPAIHQRNNLILDFLLYSGGEDKWTNQYQALPLTRPTIKSPRQGQ